MKLGIVVQWVYLLLVMLAFPVKVPAHIGPLVCVPAIPPSNQQLSVNMPGKAAFDVWAPAKHMSPTTHVWET